MKVWKLVSGILSIILSVFVVFQSLLVGVLQAFTISKEMGGIAGIVVAVILLTGGILSIVMREGSNGADIALILLFSIGGVIGLLFANEKFKDLYIWAYWCLLCAGGAGDSMIYRAIGKRKEKELWKNMQENPNFSQYPYGDPSFRYQQPQMHPYEQIPYRPYPQTPRPPYPYPPQRGYVEHPQEEIRNRRISTYREPYPYDPYYAPRYDVIDVESEATQLEEFTQGDYEDTQNSKQVDEQYRS